MLIHGELQLPRHRNLVLRQLVGAGIVVADLSAQRVLLWVRLVAAIRLDPFLNLGVSVVDHAHALVVLSVLVRDLILNEFDLLGQLLNAVDPVVEDQARIEGLGLGHPLGDKVDGEVVPGHC